MLCIEATRIASFCMPLIESSHSLASYEELSQLSIINENGVASFWEWQMFVTNDDNDFFLTKVSFFNQLFLEIIIHFHIDILGEFDTYSLSSKMCWMPHRREKPGSV